MKLSNFLLLTLIPLLFSCGQIDPEMILKKSKSKCQSVENGYYEMTKYMKYMSDQDTNSTSFNCHFEKLKDDTLYSSAFHYVRYRDTSTLGHILYTGNEFVNFREKDSSGTIMSKLLWADKIKAYRHNYTFYSPLSSRSSNPLPKDSSFIDGYHTFEMVETEEVEEVGGELRLRRVSFQPEGCFFLVFYTQ